MERSLSLTDTRRLTGANLLADVPGAILDVAFSGYSPEEVTGTWRQQIRILLDALGWGSESTAVRLFDGGASLFISAPEDLLYAATDVNEAAWEATVAALTGEPEPDSEVTLKWLKEVMAEEANPALTAILQVAHERGLNCLVDDELLTLGMGPTACSWEIDRLPAVGDINWQEIADIPLVLVTGTNGKSTSVRLLSSVISHGGRCGGITSTDFIKVGNTIVDTGDYSGPSGARTLLRQPQVDVGVLEIARGGLLRRGLPVTFADTAIITNVAEDHLGEYGINTLEELIETKFLVRKALGPDKVIILNADDPGVRAYGLALDQPICWFTINPDQELIRNHIESGGRACYLEGVHLRYIREGIVESVASVEDIPICFGGSAVYNIRNVMGVVAAAEVVGIPLEAIREGLISFENSPANNPGRGNLFTIGHCDVIVDFAHNAHGMNALVEMAERMPAKRRLITLGHAGDRTDEDIIQLTRAACRLKPDHLITIENPGHLRGRELGDIPALIRRTARAADMPEDHISYASDPLEAVRQALDWSRPGDLLVLQILQDRNAVLRLLESSH